MEVLRTVIADLGSRVLDNVGAEGEPSTKVSRLQNTRFKHGIGAIANVPPPNAGSLGVGAQGVCIIPVQNPFHQYRCRFHQICDNSTAHMS